MNGGFPLEMDNIENESRAAPSFHVWIALVGGEWLWWEVLALVVDEWLLSSVYRSFIHFSNKSILSSCYRQGGELCWATLSGHKGSPSSSEPPMISSISWVNIWMEVRLSLLPRQVMRQAPRDGQSYHRILQVLPRAGQYLNGGAAEPFIHFFIQR